MKLIQYDSGIITIGKKIVYQPLDNQLSFDELSNRIHRNFENRKRIDCYVRYNLVSLLEKIEYIHMGAYALSGFSQTSAYTKGAHTHFRKDPDQIHLDGKETKIDTKRLLHVGSGWYINESYDIKRLVETKNELEKVLSNG